MIPSVAEKRNPMLPKRFQVSVRGGQEALAHEEELGLEAVKIGICMTELMALVNYTNSLPLE